MPNDRKDRVFLSYAKEDLDTVRQVYNGLIKRGLDVWFDKEDLGPGKWKPQITRAITKSRYFVICLSNAAIRKTGDVPGFQDEELNKAYEIAMNQPEQEFTIIPIRIEYCDRGDHRLTLFQQYDLFEKFEQGLDNLAVNMGGISLSDVTAKDERSEDEKLIDRLFGKVLSELIACRYDTSMRVIESILIYSPENSYAWLFKGSILFHLGRYEEALDSCDKFLEIDPDSAMAWGTKSITLLHLARYEEALVACDKVLEIDPGSATNAHTLLHKAVALTNLGRHEKALVALDKSLETDPDNYTAWKVKGVVLGRLVRLEEALVSYDKALEIDPDKANTLLHKASALTNLARHEEALVAYDMALEINSEMAKAWTGKGYALGILCRYKEAIEALNKALELNPDDTDSLKHRDELMKQLVGND